ILMFITNSLWKNLPLSAFSKGECRSNPFKGGIPLTPLLKGNNTPTPLYKRGMVSLCKREI
ncbi:MAG: hypothetical protein ACPL7B_01025, partial [Candidatus Poribacteria bacterium]